MLPIRRAVSTIRSNRRVITSCECPLRGRLGLRDLAWKRQTDDSAYPMNFAYTGDACPGVGAPGQCSAENTCPGAFVGLDTASGTPVQCLGNNAGVSLVPLHSLILLARRMLLTVDCHHFLLIVSVRQGQCAGTLLSTFIPMRYISVRCIYTPVFPSLSFAGQSKCRPM